MKIVCPECGFTGRIKDDEVPGPDQTIGCPKCKFRFTLEQDADYFDMGTETADEPEISQTPILDSIGDPTWDGDINKRSNKSSGKRRKSKAKRDGGKRGDRIGYDVKKAIFLTISILLAIGIGFVLGKATKSAPPKVPAQPSKIVKKEEPKEKTPAPAPTEETKDEKVEETDKDKTEEVKEEPVPLPSSLDPKTEDNAETLTNVIDWENYTSDEYFNITELDTRTKEWRESNMTDIQKETEAKDYAKTFLGKNLIGQLVVKEVRRRYFSGVDFSVAIDSFPDESYKYVIKAVSAEPVSQWEHELCDVLIGMKDDETITATLRKGGKIYVEGIIYSWRMSGKTYDLYLVNSRIELLD
ncbi:MAG: zinc-ribbon domain-containing protein [Deltaproteobacteria bacterium]|uniref:Zinc-ribbon domain-containing protein n=1 Tax=Candidatus Zymogenus saltonus TaxID=2844893 RepID=A0A9D8KIM7_9DELT|nr:zinc-ribbon domain-containing protein [Candidatus Zymogenus saltonus]